MNNLPASIQSELSRMRGLSLDQIQEAYFSQTSICGFYILAMGIQGAVGERVELKDIRLKDAQTGMEIYLDKDGKANITE